MKTPILKLIIAALICLLCGSLAHAIKVTIPDQYKDQVEAIKKAERTQLERELNATERTPVKSPDQEGSMQFTSSGDSETDAAANPDSQNQADGNEFLAQSLEEANTTAGEYQLNPPEGQGFVSGQVVDKATGQPVSGVAILLEGTEVGTITDSDGRYTLGPAPAGEYTINFIKSGYIEANVTDFAVVADEISVFPFALPPRPTEMSDEVYVLQDFSVTAEEANDMMLKLDLVMNSDSIMSVMSSEDFSKFAASDIGDAVKRVSGVSVVGGKYAVIRGLGDRYVWTTMNGLPIASPDPDKMAVQLDLFPSSLFESIEVNKTFTPDQSGTATGAINLKLKSLPEEFFMNVSTSVGYHSIATGNDNFLTNDRGGSLDQFAMGAEDRGLPSGAKVFPKDLNKTVNPFPFPIPGTINQAQKDAAVAEAVAITDGIGRDFHNYGDAPGPDYGVKLSFGDAHDINERVRAGYFAGVNYSRKFRMIENAKYFRSATETSGTATLSPENFVDPDLAIGYRNQSRTESTATSVLSGLVGFGLEIGADHAFSLSRLDLKQSEDENVRLVGDVFNEFPFSSDSDFLDTEIAESLRYTERRLVSDQISGSHRFELNKDFLADAAEVDWALGRDTATQEEPGFVQTRAIVLDSGDLTIAQDSTAPGAASPSFVVWREVEEERQNGRIDIALLGAQKDGFESQFKFGLLKSQGDRSVLDEYVSLLGDDLSNSADTTVDASGDPNAPMGNFDGLGASDYKVAADISLETEQDGRYIMFEQQFFEKFRVIGGYRHEKNSAAVQVNGDLQLRGAGSNNPLKDLPKTGGYDDDRWLPGLTFIYKPTEQMSVKAAYSKTLALPSAREVSPYASSAFSGSDIDVGNLNLSPSSVENFDLGFNWFNREGDSFGITLFYKTVQDRIERLNGIGADDLKDGLVNPDPFVYSNYNILTFSDNLDAALYSWYNNPNEATLLGVEVEGRKALGFFHESLEHISVGGNFTFIDGEVDRFPIEIAAKNFAGRPISQSRALSNQPEYIVNADITYDNPNLGLRVSLIAYHISEVLQGVSFVDSYDVSAKAYTALDLTASKTFKDGLQLSLSIKNITDSERGTFYDVEGSQIGRDSYEVGQSVSLSLSYGF
jgi:outer membrane receptor protein involved in Fe transport